MKRLLIVCLDAYRIALRPYMPPACRFHPSCADFSREAISRHGAFRGLALSLRRVLRCQPFHAGGLDPVPGHTLSF
ncbi:MAG: membrane protein insertion efficiency factor YidD [Elusimicrobiota bacterium]